MADELTPDERRELDAIDRALSGRAVDPDLADIAALANELRATRAEPSAEYTQRLDRRAAELLADAGAARRPRRAWLRIGLPALAAGVAAVVVAVAVMGGEDGDEGTPALALNAVPEEQRSSAVAAPESAPKTDDADSGGGEGFVGRELELLNRRVPAGEPFVIHYELLSTVEATVDFAGRRGEISLEPGVGRLEVGTSGVEPGRQDLSVILQPGGSLHMKVVVAP